MERKLNLDPDFLEVGITFDSTGQAITFIEELLDTAKKELIENEGWPSQIYWDKYEVHFYIDAYMWRDAKNYIREIEDRYTILEYEGFPLSITPVEYSKNMLEFQQKKEELLYKKQESIIKLLAYFGYKPCQEIEFIDHKAPSYNHYYIIGVYLTEDKIPRAIFTMVEPTISDITNDKSSGFTTSFDLIQPKQINK